MDGVGRVGREAGSEGHVLEPLRLSDFVLP